MCTTSHLVLKSPFAVGGCTNYRVSTLEKHERTAEHRCVVVASTQKNTPVKVIESTIADNEKCATIALKTVYHMIKTGIPLSSYGEGLHFLKDCRVSIDKLAVGENATYHLYPMKQLVLSLIRMSKSFWIRVPMFSYYVMRLLTFFRQGNLIVYARGIDDNLGVKTYFLADADIIEITANGITSKLKEVLTSRSVSLSKVFSLGTDGCSTMMGNKNGVGYS